MPIQTGTTIAAISTAVSSAGIAVVRMAGKDSFRIADCVYESKKGKILQEQKPYTIHYGYIKDGEKVIDEVLVMLMKAPHSYTGEDTVEINCHGGIYVVKRVLELLIEHGARPAEPGEFTKRAFLNGRLDLSQAEAVADLIQSQNEYALQNSIGQLRGNVKDKIKRLRDKILYHTAFIETALDDPEHISVDGYGETLDGVMDDCISQIDRLLDTYEDGRILREGIRTVIVGKPNAGKSSLLNLLLGEERAIVTDVAGTTRDILEEHINIQGISLNIIDTAGIRDTEDAVEIIGVNRAKQCVDSADLILYVVDSSRMLDENDFEIMRMLKDRKTIILLNKSDLDTVVGFGGLRETFREKSGTDHPIIPVEKDTGDTQVHGRKDKAEDKNGTPWKKDENVYAMKMSAKKREGLDLLVQLLKTLFFEGNISFNDEICISNVRQKTSLQDSRQSLLKVKESIESGMPEDFYSIDLMDAYEALGRITGESVGDDLVNEIFSKFCMGK